jgi:hypothetical protein
MSDDDERRSLKEAVRVRLLEQALEDTLQLNGRELKLTIECLTARPSADEIPTF